MAGLSAALLLPTLITGCPFAVSDNYQLEPAADCRDRVLNGMETDVDCGGSSCPACEATERCAVGDDCSSRICDGDVCSAPSCTDGVLNGDENAVDCGGVVCAPCGGADSGQ